MIKSIEKVNKEIIKSAERLNKQIINCIQIYKKLFAAATTPFVVDGPPFVTGKIHVGTAYNKLLKSVVQSFYEYRLPGITPEFKRGYDAQGLPNELAILIDLKLKSRSEALEYGLTKLMAHGSNFIDQKIHDMDEEFKKLNLNKSLFKAPYYSTASEKHLAHNIQSLKKLSDSGFISYGYRIVDYCNRCETVMALSEIQPKGIEEFGYHFKFEINQRNAFALVYTTTPWTIYCNKLIAYNPKFSYGLYSIDDTADLYIFADELRVNLECFYPKIELIEPLESFKLAGLKYKNPCGVLCSFVPWPQISDLGTGLVHLAPCHSELDNALCLKHEVVAECKLAEYQIKLSNDISSIKNSGIDSIVLNKFKIFHEQNHCWRCKNPTFVIWSSQVFIDYSSVKVNLANELSKIYTIPVDCKSEIIKNILNRPKWCISRQRLWGTPIPLWICNTCKNFEFFGLDSIQLKMKEQNLSSLRLDTMNSINFDCSKCQGKLYHCNHVTDVWLESGLVILAEFSKDMYSGDTSSITLIESVDQRRGWFLSTAIVSYLLEGLIPYSMVLNHGYVMRDSQNKLSKSAGGSEFANLSLMSESELIKLSESLLSRPAGESSVLNIQDYKGEGEIKRIVQELKKFEEYYEI